MRKHLFGAQGVIPVAIIALLMVSVVVIAGNSIDNNSYVKTADLDSGKQCGAFDGSNYSCGAKAKSSGDYGHGCTGYKSKSENKPGKSAPKSDNKSRVKAKGSI